LKSSWYLRIIIVFFDYNWSIKKCQARKNSSQIKSSQAADNFWSRQANHMTLAGRGLTLTLIVIISPLIIFFFQPTNYVPQPYEDYFDPYYFIKHIPPQDEQQRNRQAVLLRIKKFLRFVNEKKIKTKHFPVENHFFQFYAIQVYFC
jgi:hypothetical protein